MRLFFGLSPALALVAGLLAAGACTSFGFAGGRAQAPDELRDRGQMIKLRAASFKMGEAQGEPHEYPVHQVELSAFVLDRLEVSNAQYRRCVEAQRCRATRQMSDPHLSAPAQPVVGVTYLDARAYCRWVGKRLPSEAEWERAARGSDGRRYPFGEVYEPDRGNIRGAADGYTYTAPVGALRKGCTPEGVCDLCGNAAEWVQDWFSPTYYSKSPARDPQGPSSSTRQRVLRGGSWTGNAYEARATARDALDPAFSKDSVGFRCAAAAD